MPSWDHRWFEVSILWHWSMCFTVSKCTHRTWSLGLEPGMAHWTVQCKSTGEVIIVCLKPQATTVFLKVMPSWVSANGAKHMCICQNYVAVMLLCMLYVYKLRHTDVCICICLTLFSETTLTVIMDQETQATVKLCDNLSVEHVHTTKDISPLHNEKAS